MYMSKELLKPKIDLVFHSLFTEENKELLEGLISDILGEEVKVVSTDKDRHVLIKHPEEKLGILDLRTELENGTQCNIEIQLQKEKYEEARILYYWADTYTRQLMRGFKYGGLKKTVSIVILDHDIEPIKNLEELGTKWQIRDNKTGQKILTDRLEIVIINISKAEKAYKENKNDKIAQWLMFLNDPNKKEVRDIMEENEKIKEAVERLEEISDNRELRRLAELREKGRRDYEAAIEYATDEGMSKGIERGAYENSIEIAKKLILRELTIEQIEDITGLNKEEIEKLKVNA